MVELTGGDVVVVVVVVVVDVVVEGVEERVPFGRLEVVGVLVALVLLGAAVSFSAAINIISTSSLIYNEKYL